MQRMEQYYRSVPAGIGSELDRCTRTLCFDSASVARGNKSLETH